MIDVRRRLFVLPALLPVLSRREVDGSKDEQATIARLVHELLGACRPSDLIQIPAAAAFGFGQRQAA